MKSLSHSLILLKEFTERKKRKNYIKFENNNSNLLKKCLNGMFICSYLLSFIFGYANDDYFVMKFIFSMISFCKLV